MSDPTPIDRGRRVERVSHLRWVPIPDMRVSPVSQREFSQAHAEEYAANFDLEGFGFPVVNHRDGHWYIVDGQHRVAALRLIGWGDQQIQCEAYEGLSEPEEAELFLKRNRRRSITAFDRFRIAVNAGRPQECDIERIVRTQGLHISKDAGGGAVSAVAGLYNAYTLDGDGVAMGVSLRVLHHSFGDSKAVFRSELIYGMALVAHRYGAQLSEDRAVAQLAAVPAGVTGLTTKVHLLKKNFGRPLPQCAAAAIVEAYNAGRGGKKLDGWLL